MNFRTRILFLFLSLLTIRFIFPANIYAHVLKTDGDIGAVLHINPSDDPVAGEQSGFFFEFKDKTGHFKPENCDCKFSVVQGGKEINSQTLFQSGDKPDLESASVFFTFPQKDVYQLKVTGTPKTSGDFQSFSLTYDIRVDRESTDGTTVNDTSESWLQSHWPHLVVGGVVLGILILVVIKQKVKK